MDFKVFSLNCWGIPVVSKDRKSRFAAIAEALSTSAYDILCLQEVWADSDFVALRDKIKGAYPHSHYFYSGVIGSGVCFFSKHPILDVFFHQWTLNGYIHKIQHADWFGGKGIGMCKLKVNGFNINVYSAHLHAEYNRINDEYQCHRVQQAFDSAQFIQLTSTAADLVILAGDLNTEPGDLAYRIIVHLTGLRDSYTEVRDDCKHVHKSSSSTNEAFYNSYADKRSIKNGDAGKRIDYVMYRGFADVKVRPRHYCHPFPTRVPDAPFSYSDHEAIAATLSVRRAEEPCADGIDSETCRAILEEGVSISEAALKRLRSKRFGFWLVTSLFFLALVCSMPFDAPPGYNVLVHVARLLVTILMCYTFVMGSLWHNTETHGILAGKLAMEVALCKDCKENVSEK